MSSSNSYHHHHSDNSPTSSYNDSIHSNHSTPIHLMKRNRFISKQQFYSVETDIIHCICMTIVNQMNEAELDGYYPSQAYDLFNKEKTSYSFGPLGCSLDTVEFIFTSIHKESQMEYECMIITLIYMERLSKMTGQGFRICMWNWRYTLLVCMMLASKVFDDFSMNNFDFADIFCNVHLKHVNLMEVQILKIFNFNVEVSSEEYMSYHTKIQELIVAARMQAVHERLELLDCEDETESDIESVRLSSGSQSANSIKGSFNDERSLGHGTVVANYAQHAYRLFDDMDTSAVKVSPCLIPRHSPIIGPPPQTQASSDFTENHDRKVMTSVTPVFEDSVDDSAETISSPPFPRSRAFSHPIHFSQSASSGASSIRRSVSKAISSILKTLSASSPMVASYPRKSQSKVYTDTENNNSETTVSVTTTSLYAPNLTAVDEPSPLCDRST